MRYILKKTLHVAFGAYLLAGEEVRPFSITLKKDEDGFCVPVLYAIEHEAVGRFHVPAEYIVQVPYRPQEDVADVEYREVL
ncbi:hypothetical protein [Burkholderia multivorans]|uniref:hypothetical protein n=1 Tax=Burkholderia multivorans TaxID=87883 RepID=UPI001B98CA93|nr:hypothetical protein [Burkholderia multivorans]MBR8019524.1 hypothetical protein [Burkholderia multivorans]MBU9647827.1 hypothetical protein [Burkholderia multivorans]MDN8008217.1 hypothetical protein [Burkholderia multivorans]HEF4730006.1 hypothetical protein [Burkholderia multivorans]HEF4734302.1 hypothetical protein [Burkholderia multivorans]